MRTLIAELGPVSFVVRAVNALSLVGFNSYVGKSLLQLLADFICGETGA